MQSYTIDGSADDVFQFALGYINDVVHQLDILCGHDTDDTATITRARNIYDYLMGINNDKVLSFVSLDKYQVCIANVDLCKQVYSNDGIYLLNGLYIICCIYDKSQMLSYHPFRAIPAKDLANFMYFGRLIKSENFTNLYNFYDPHGNFVSHFYGTDWNSIVEFMKGSEFYVQFGKLRDGGSKRNVYFRKLVDPTDLGILRVAIKNKLPTREEALKNA